MPKRCITSNDLGERLDEKDKNSPQITMEMVCPAARSSVGQCNFRTYDNYHAECLFDDLIIYHKRMRSA